MSAHELFCPFPEPSVHPDVDSLADEVVAWTRAAGLLSDDPGAEAKARSYTGLAARCYPSAPIERLVPIARYFGWLFHFDDAIEGLSIRRTPIPEVAGALAGTFGVLRGEGAGEGLRRFADPLRQIWAGFSEGTPPAWRRRFVRHVDNYVEGCVWEATNRELGRIPSRAVFESMRTYTSSLYQFWDLVEYAGGFALPDDAFEQPLISELTRAANAATSYANDLFSFEKEALAGDVHNLVLVVAADERLPFPAARERVRALHDAQVRHFCALELSLPADPDLRRYVDGLRGWMRANRDWSQETARYADA